jgi:hypothetical protein
VQGASERLTPGGTDGGTVALLTNVGSVIAACDAVALEVPDTRQSDAMPGGRAVLADDGSVIRLALYSEAGTVTAANLSPRRAVALAGELIAAAAGKLPR